MKKAYITFAVLGLFVSTIGVAAAQTATVIAAPVSSSCISLSTNMRLGATDAVTGGAVSALQNYLASMGYFNAAYIGTGRFGPLTLASVMRYQAAIGLPATGYAGPMTRAAIQQRTCGTVVVPPQQTLSLYSLSPSVAQVGNQVIINGFGFGPSNTIYMDGSVAAQNVPVSSSGIAIACTNDPNCHGGVLQSLIFTVPAGLSPYCAPGMYCAMMIRQTTPGNYNVTVQNSNGTSNALVLTVVGTSNNQSVSISGLDAPSSLTIGQSGTWTVHATVPNTAGTLHYSVVWGDEGYMMNGIMMPQQTSVQTSATFTHTYSLSGRYTPVFTVTDDYGHSATVSSSTLVNPIY